MEGAGDDDEAKLMLAYRAGDIDAFKQLYARQRAPLYRFLLHQLGNRASADELFQETWSRVIAARDRYRPSAKFSTWLLQIAHNLVVDHHRNRRAETGTDEAATAIEQQAAPVTEAPDHVLSTFEQRRRLQRALEKLPDEQRTAFLLRMRPLALDEIAAITGAGRETVKSRLRYAFRRIREELAE